jgi:alpha-D-ribose 1-methylphosphonate 5-triphosphate diphosphatase
MAVAMGAPNIVLGGSHSGNVAAMELAERGILDILTSDYVPASLLHAVFIIGERLDDLPAAVRMASATPAAAIGLADRGEIATGRRADLVRVRIVDGLPVARETWVAGRHHS